MSGMKFEKEIFMKYLIEREASEATKKKYMTDVIIPGLSEPPVRTLRATCPENESHIFR